MSVEGSDGHCKIWINNIKDKLTIMNEITIISILEKIRSVCKECKLDSIPDRVVNNNHLHLEAYMKALEYVRL